ncbi:MAG TPA: PRD domain-containing protein [Candidatus Lachnoclostridium pullistercoris]|uniref:PRD domain-containing protein n=1 Tax=Candidatus Lachnoclostridium pullistercoris TaxID=2838632 RepID=A0A9D2PD17_9FIRM|nr:PRD domain-containing protein [Candidatus Lachnoclostridium pullistercoris]
MKITRVINNNVVAAVDDESHELVLMGNGIGFHRKLGDEVDPAAVEKTFTRSDEKWVRNFKRLSEEIPYEYMHMTNEIINYAQLSLGKELNEDVYIALTDHLNFAIQRVRQGVVLTNSMLWEIKHYYSHEFQIGQEAIAIIRRYTGIEMPVDEAGFIAMHILNSELDIDMDLSRLITRIIQDVLNIITYHFHIVIDEESLDYERFVTHLKFFIQRAIHENESKIWDQSLMDMIRAQYLESYDCASKVAAYIQKTTPYRVSEEETIYLTVHIQRLQTSSRRIGDEE